jgi:ankyrin repeat protein
MKFNIDKFLSIDYSMDIKKEREYIKKCGFKPEDLASHMVELFFENKTVMQCIVDHSGAGPINNFYQLGIDFESVSCDGLTPLSYCVKVGDVAKFYQLLKLGVNPNIKNEDGSIVFDLIKVSDQREWFESLMEASKRLKE